MTPAMKMVEGTRLALVASKNRVKVGAAQTALQKCLPAICFHVQGAPSHAQLMQL